MKIQIWSDVYCPFCYIGEKTLEEALKKYPQAKDVEIEFKSFELDPNLDNKENLSMYDYVAKKYSLSDEQVRKNHEHIFERGVEVGIDFQFEKIVLANTFNAHRLLQFAKTKNKSLEMSQVLFKAMFTDGLDVNNYDVLVNLSEKVGFDKNEVREILESDAFTDEVRLDEYQGSAIGVRSVPFFLFDEKLAVSGAQHISTFESAIEKAFGLKQQVEILGDDNSSCGPDGCQIR